MPVINDAALDLICEFEGFVNHWYPDPAHGWKVPTCCYGHTDAAGEPQYVATKAKTFTKAEGRAILERDLAATAAKVRQSVKVELNANQFGALVSLAFNIGHGAFGRSTLVKKLNKGDYESAANEFGRWVNAGGKKLNGLVRRRAAEATLFRSGVFVTEPSPDSETPPAGLAGLLAAIIKALMEWIKGLRK
jgi:lysozyme